jgi:O-acetyl-ADP-ribose deacetylase (regulator of RNase III)
MIKVTVGNVLDEKSGLIVHGCNDQGVMGAGIAAQIKSRFPDAYEVYHETYLAGELKLGTVSGAGIDPDGDGDCQLMIINAVTQTLDSQKCPVSYDAVVSCFEEVASFLEELWITQGTHYPVKLPALVAQIGGSFRRSSMPASRMITKRPSSS